MARPAQMVLVMRFVQRLLLALAILGIAGGALVASKDDLSAADQASATWVALLCAGLVGVLLAAEIAARSNHGCGIGRLNARRRRQAQRGGKRTVILRHVLLDLPNDGDR